MERKPETIRINDPAHPCYDCKNRKPESSKGIINNDTVCLDEHEPKTNCPYRLTFGYPL